MSSTRHLAAIAICVATVSGCGPASRPRSQPAPDPAAIVNAVANRYYTETLERRPEAAYFSGVDLARHDGIQDVSPAALRSAEAAEDDMLRELERVDAESLLGRSEWITHAYLSQALESSIAQRVCRRELWLVNQMGGWHSGYARIAQLQPVGTPALRAQSLARWSKLAAYVDQQIENLKAGLELGYSAPKPVVKRVIDQVDGLLALEIERSPFYSPAVRDDDAAFAAVTRDIVAEQIHPALKRFRDFLAHSYLDRARAELSITANPDGLACYQASLRAYTTLDRPGEEVYELGARTVAANKAKVIELGREAYGTEDFELIMERAKGDPEDRFADRQELLDFSREAVRRAQAEMPNWVKNMPAQPVEVVPFEAHEEGTGRSAHYRPGTTERPGEYRIPLHQPEEQSRGNAEAVAFHETWPGHHLQVAVAKSVEGLHPVTRIIWFSGPGEGWARYAEGLAEEMGLYRTTTGPILRRAWPARGMVVDPGLHLLGWTRQRAIDFMLESGRFSEARADEMVDRIAILPGQLTAYDSGGLEILALRRRAEDVMGEDFDIGAFHHRVLESGTIPLASLRAHIQAWLSHYERSDR